MYYAENEAQPELFASIPHAMWWALVTLATVGYRDMYPVTPVGKGDGGMVLIVGIAIFALPTAIMAPGSLRQPATRRAVALMAGRRRSPCLRLPFSSPQSRYP